MLDYGPHTIETAPEASKPTLEAVKSKVGFVPNLMANMAESPVLVESYLTMMGLFDKTSLSPTEREIILMTNNRLNGCTYCMAAHSTVAKRAGIDDSVIDALRSGSRIDDPKLEALRRFSITMHETRGHPTEAQVEGTSFSRRATPRKRFWKWLLEPALKVLSNYTTPIVETRARQSLWPNGLD